MVSRNGQCFLIKILYKANIVTLFVFYSLSLCLVVFILFFELLFYFCFRIIEKVLCFLAPRPKVVFVKYHTIPMRLVYPLVLLFNALRNSVFAQ